MLASIFVYVRSASWRCGCLGVALNVEPISTPLKGLRMITELRILEVELLGSLLRDGGVGGVGSQLAVRAIRQQRASVLALRAVGALADSVRPLLKLVDPALGPHTVVEGWTSSASSRRSGSVAVLN